MYSTAFNTGPFQSSGSDCLGEAKVGHVANAPPYPETEPKFLGHRVSVEETNARAAVNARGLGGAGLVQRKCEALPSWFLVGEHPPVIVRGDGLGENVTFQEEASEKWYVRVGRGAVVRESPPPGR